MFIEKKSDGMVYSIRNFIDFPRSEDGARVSDRTLRESSTRRSESGRHMHSIKDPRRSITRPDGTPIIRTIGLDGFPCSFSKILCRYLTTKYEGQNIFVSVRSFRIVIKSILLIGVLFFSTVYH